MISWRAKRKAQKIGADMRYYRRNRELIALGYPANEVWNWPAFVRFGFGRRVRYK